MHSVGNVNYELYLLCQRGGMRFLLNAASVSEIGRVGALSQLSGVDPLIAGTMVFHGQCAGAIDLLSLIGGCQGATAPSLFVATRSSHPRVVLVDSVEGLPKIQTGGIVPSAAPFVIGFASLSSLTVPVIDPDFLEAIPV